MCAVSAVGCALGFHAVSTTARMSFIRVPAVVMSSATIVDCRSTGASTASSWANAGKFLRKISTLGAGAAPVFLRG